MKTLWFRVGKTLAKFWAKLKKSWAPLVNFTAEGPCLSSKYRPAFTCNFTNTSVSWLSRCGGVLHPAAFRFAHTLLKPSLTSFSLLFTLGSWERDSAKMLAGVIQLHIRCCTCSSGQVYAAIRTAYADGRSWG